MNSFFKIIVIIYISFNFLGCTTVDVQSPNKVNNQDILQDDSEDFDDFSDFEEEMKIEVTYDPFSSYNRTMTGFNDSLYVNIISPINTGYKIITTQDIRNSINNFFNNLYFPMNFINNIFQGKIDGALVETGRFLVNTTVGILGLFDPAKNQLGLYPRKEDFGQTLGFYGVGAGPHIVLPFFGPSNLRDVLSMFPDAMLSPIDYTSRPWWTMTDTYAQYLSIKTVEKFNHTSLYSSQYDQIKKDAVDLYPYLREIYEQMRIKEIEE